MRGELEEHLGKVAKHYRRLPNTDARIAYLENQIRNQQQRLQENWATFRHLIDTGTLEGDPVDIHSDLDEDALAIGRMKVWLEQERSGVNLKPGYVDEADQEEVQVESHGETQEALRYSDKEYLSVEDLCAYLDVAKNTVYDWRKKGTIPFTKVGRHLRFSRKEIDRWLRKRSEKEL